MYFPSTVSPVDTVELIPDINAVGAKGFAISQRSTNGHRRVRSRCRGRRRWQNVCQPLYSQNAGAKMQTPHGRKASTAPSVLLAASQTFTKDPVAGSGRRMRFLPYSHQTPVLEKNVGTAHGFCAEKKARPVPMHRPEHDFKTDDYYIGDPHRNLIAKRIFRSKRSSFCKLNLLQMTLL